MLIEFILLQQEQAYNAGYASKRTLESLTDTPVELGVASEWGYDMPILSEKPFFIYLSQSGKLQIHAKC